MTKQYLFLDAFAELGTVQAACVQNGLPRRTIYNWINHDEGFARQFHDAREVATDMLDAECRRRAVDGVAEPVYHHGEIVGYRRRYSDPCLLALLSAYRPERFKPRHQHSGEDGRPLGPTVVHVSYEKMKPDDLTETGFSLGFFRFRRWGRVTSVDRANGVGENP